MPPAFVAYDATLTADLVVHRPMHGIRTFGSGYPVLVPLHRYLFNFDRNGKLRDVEYISYENFKFWMDRWGGNLDVPDTSASISSSPAITTRTPVEAEQDSTSSPYEQIMKALSGADNPSHAFSSAALATLQAELKATQSELHDTQKQLSNTEIARVAEAAAKQKAIERASVASRGDDSEVQSTRALLEEAKEIAAKATSDCDRLEKKVGESVVGSPK
ncbi:hypothetical protein E8E11_003997 [Didymella keratinophila]|nr:hypothetical protein E8E11_003997 [Didymella keratinophila]